MGNDFVWGAVDRPHTIWRYTDQLYKVVQFYDVRPLVLSREPSNFKHSGKRLDASVSRSRRVLLEKALCNHWEWFCTFTLNPSWWDRHSLPDFHKAFSQWIRDQRKKGADIKFLLVPEKHQDGAWHCHGLLSGVSESDLELFRDMDARGYRSPEGRRLPRDLINSNYFNWSPYSRKFGYCSLGPVKSQVGSAFYLVKYITKDLTRSLDSLGLHCYWPSRGLAGAVKHVDFYGRDPDLERILVNKYDYCRTGMTTVADGCDWTFGFEYLDFKQFEPLFPALEQLEDEFRYYDGMQLDFWTD